MENSFEGLLLLFGFIINEFVENLKEFIDLFVNILMGKLFGFRGNFWCFFGGDGIIWNYQILWNFRSNVIKSHFCESDFVDPRLKVNQITNLFLF